MMLLVPGRFAYLSQSPTLFFQDHASANMEGLDPGHAKMVPKPRVGPYWTRTQDPAKKLGKSWVVASYPERVLEVFLSQAHTQMTALSHYLGLPFTQSDKGAMLEYVSGWA